MPLVDYLYDPRARKWWQKVVLTTAFYRLTPAGKKMCVAKSDKKINLIKNFLILVHDQSWHVVNRRTGKGGGADSALPSCFLWISLEVFVRSPWFFQYLPKNKRRTFWCKNCERLGGGGARSRSRIAGSGGRASLRPAANGRVADGGGPMKTNEGTGSIYLHVRHIALKIKMRVCKYYSNNVLE